MCRTKKKEKCPTNLIKRVLFKHISDLLANEWKKLYHRMLDISVNSRLLWVHPDLDSIIDRPKHSIHPFMEEVNFMLTV